MKEVVIYIFQGGQYWQAYCDEPRINIGGTSRFHALDSAQKQIEEAIGPTFRTVLIDEGPRVDETTDEIMHAWQIGKRARDWPIAEEYLALDSWPSQFSSLQPLLLIYYFHLDRRDLDLARAAIDRALPLVRRYRMAGDTWGGTFLYEAAYVRALQRTELEAAQTLILLGPAGSPKLQERANLALDVALGRKAEAFPRYEACAPFIR